MLCESELKCLQDIFELIEHPPSERLVSISDICLIILLFITIFYIFYRLTLCLTARRSFRLPRSRLFEEELSNMDLISPSQEAV